MKDYFNKKINNFKRRLKEYNLGKNKFNSIEMMIVSFMGIMLGILIGELVFNKVTVVGNKDLSEFNEVYETLTSDYYKDVDKDELESAAIEGMINLLEDKYSMFFTSSEAKDFNEKLDGYFIGLGAEITTGEDKISYVVSVMDNSPAKKAGLLKGDKILKVDGKDVTGKTITEISELIKGKKKAVELLIEREGANKTLKITTGKVDIQSVFGEVIEDGNNKIGYIYFSVFALNTDEQFKAELEKLEKQGIDSLIIDVRGNLGGHLDTTINIASLFLDKTKPVIQIKNKINTKVMKSNSDETRNYPIVILINNGSASGSEVLASALQEQYGATLIGTTTYGKGTVQKSIKLSSGKMVKYTAETWLTSKGNSIDQTGIKPDKEVTLDDKFYETLLREDDNQLQSAIDTIKSK